MDNLSRVSFINYMVSRVNTALDRGCVTVIVAASGRPAAGQGCRPAPTGASEIVSALLIGLSHRTRSEYRLAKVRPITDCEQGSLLVHGQ
jgi:hypothetical protein